MTFGIYDDEFLKASIREVAALAERLGVPPAQKKERSFLLLKENDAAPGYEVLDIVRACEERLDLLEGRELIT